MKGRHRFLGLACMLACLLLVLTFRVAMAGSNSSQSEGPAVTASRAIAKEDRIASAQLQAGTETAAILRACRGRILHPF